MIPAQGTYWVDDPIHLPQFHAVHLPVQLIEAGENIIAFFIFYQIAKRTGRGVAVSAYFISYGVLRFINEFWRGDNPKIFGLLTPAQLIGTVLIPLGVIFLIYFLKHDRKNA